MKRLVDHVLAALPFEQDWFVERGISSTLVGHPFFDELLREHDRPTDLGDDAAGAATPTKPLLLILPGSRTQEIEANLGTLLRAAERVREACPLARPVIAALHARHADRVRRELARLDLAIPVEVGKTRRLIARATAAVAVSGSVSLELLAARVPTVIVYRISGLAYVVQSWFRHARFITLVNLLGAERPIGTARGQWWPPRAVAASDPAAVYPEYLAVQDPAAEMAGHVIEWLMHPASRQAVVERLDRIAAGVTQGGSAARAAEAVLEIAERRSTLLHPQAIADRVRAA